jgi:signal transduction histidine kinase
VPALLTDDALHRLLDAGRLLVSELDVEAVLDHVLVTAAGLTGARYAALGVLDEDRSYLERFLTHGASEETRQAIGHLPRGHGVLGAVIRDPRPLRIDALGDDGFPPGHPPMRNFLGVPILIRGEAWGNLYLCEKDEPFSEADEAAVVVLAEWAAIAIDNARLYERSEARVRRLEATTAIARALGGETELDRVLELIAAHGQALIGARGLMILLREPDGLVVAAGSGEIPSGVRGRRVAGAGEALSLVGGDGVLVPLVFRGQSLGMLATLGTRKDEPLLRALAASAATAVATARTVAEQRLRDAMHAAEEERRRWARELHDDTLQGLGGLRMLLNAALRSDEPKALLAKAVTGIEREIDDLRGLIRELRPAALDELGLAAAIEGFADRLAVRGELEVSADVQLVAARHIPELETAVYRIVQEAVTNAVRHAHPNRVEIAVTESGGHLHVRVDDDGRGFDPSVPSDGFGLTGMRERVSLLHGELEVESSALGTTISATLPAR